jgi:phage terminase small subunit
MIEHIVNMRRAMLHLDTELEQNNAPSFNFDEAVDLCGLSNLQRDFVKAILRGANRTQAARAAGYSGTDEQLRGAGYKAYNSPKVQAFLSLAKQEGCGVPDEPGDASELKHILWKHARGDDKNHAIRAAEVLHRIEKEEAANANDLAEENPLQILERIARLDPFLAKKLAEEQNINWKPEGWDALRHCSECGQLIPLSTN